MQTHVFAHATPGMKNLTGLFPGAVYEAPRKHMHQVASKVEATATAAATVDMVRADPPGLSVIDGTTAMEGGEPSQGQTFRMDVIVAGANPPAADMVGASLVGFPPDEAPPFAWAGKAG